MLSSTLDENRRREYLAALGVPLFVSRRVLPGAATSVVIAPVVSPTLGPNLAPQAEPSPVAKWELPRPTLLAKADLPQPAIKPEPSPVSPKIIMPPAEPAPRFACRLMALGEQGFVLIDLGQFPDVIAGEVLSLAPAEQQLWRNLQRAVGWQPSEPEPDFIWPRAVKGLLGDDADTARDMLSAWLKRQIPADVRLWVFGEALAPFLTRPHRLLPSLQQLLLSPLAKRQVWQQLCRFESAT